MSFPNIIFGGDGDQFRVYAPAAALQGGPSVGQQMVFDDGRKFRYASAGAVALAVANLQQAPIPVANHVLQTAAAAAVGATSVALTLVSTAANSISLVPNTYQGVILAVATNPTATIACVSVRVIPIGDFGWVQTRGACMCLTTGTLVIGEKVFASTTTGAVIAEAAFSVEQTVGFVLRVATTTDYSTIDIRIDG